MWKIFKKKKPEKEGWYLCTYEVENFQRYVMNLYWWPKKQKFIDNIREDVVDTYNVMGLSGERIHDIGQDRTDMVIAWRKLPKPYMRGFVKEEY